MAVSLAVMALCAGMVPGVMAADTDTGTNWKFGVSVGPDVKPNMKERQRVRLQKLNPVIRLFYRLDEALN